MAHEYSTADLMAAILDLRDGVAERFVAQGERLAGVERGLDSLRYDINKRFDSVDSRFDVFERRLHLLEAR